jgi:hypothetical protein
MEAELRRRVRTELTQARVEADGELTDAALANAIARAIGAALGWHLESPEHARNATLSSRTWRPASGPRGAGGGPAPGRREFDSGPYEDRRPPPGPRGSGGGFGPRRGGPPKRNGGGGFGPRKPRRPN